MTLTRVGMQHSPARRAMRWYYLFAVINLSRASNQYKYCVGNVADLNTILGVAKRAGCSSSSSPRGRRLKWRFESPSKSSLLSKWVKESEINLNLGFKSYLVTGVVSTNRKGIAKAQVSWTTKIDVESRVDGSMTFGAGERMNFKWETVTAFQGTIGVRSSVFSSATYRWLDATYLPAALWSTSFLGCVGTIYIHNAVRTCVSLWTEVARARRVLEDAGGKSG